MLLLDEMDNQLYFPVIDYLFELKVDFLSKDRAGFSGLDYAVETENVEFLSRFFDFTIKGLVRKAKMPLDSALQKLRQMKNLTVQIDWSVKNMIPFVGLFLPQDTITIRKRDNQLSMTFTLIKFKKLWSQPRRKTTILIDFDKPSVSHPSLAPFTAFLIDHKRKVYCSLNEPFKLSEKKTILKGMMISRINRVKCFISSKLEPNIKKKKNQFIYSTKNSAIFNRIQIPHPSPSSQPPQKASQKASKNHQPLFPPLKSSSSSRPSLEDPSIQSTNFKDFKDLLAQIDSRVENTSKIIKKKVDLRISMGPVQGLDTSDAEVGRISNSVTL